MHLCVRTYVRVLQGSDVGFVRKCRDVFQKNKNFVPHRGDFPLFSVKHYAAEVTIDCTYMLLSVCVCACVRACVV